MTDMYRTPKESDDEISSRLVSILTENGNRKPRDLVNEVAEEHDYESVQFVLKQLMLENTIRIKADGECSVDTGSEQ